MKTWHVDKMQEVLPWTFIVVLPWQPGEASCWVPWVPLGPFGGCSPLGSTGSAIMFLIPYQAVEREAGYPAALNSLGHLW